MNIASYIYQSYSTCVRADVFLQSAKSCEHFLAFSALVWFVVAVDREVDLEVSGSSKSSSTFFALEWLLT